MTITKRVQKILSRPGVTKFFLILFLSNSILQTSCNKASEVGLDVQPSTDLLEVNFIDTTNLITRTVKEDSLRTDQNQLQAGYGLLGKCIDPVFGTTTSSIYTQVRLPSSISSNSFGKFPTCDSVILSLIYDPSYIYKWHSNPKGEWEPQTINVYELLNGITPGANYYSNSSQINTTVDLANNFSFIPRPKQITSVFAVKAQLRIPLSKVFGQNLLNNTGNLINNSTFQSVMKGLYITTENTMGLNADEGNIMRFLMNSSKMTIFYHSAQIPLEKNSFTKYEFSLGSVSHYMHFSHDYSVSDANLSSQLSSAPPAQNNTVYVQSMAGLKTKVEMPSLLDWVKNGPVAINKAVLVIKLDSSQINNPMNTFSQPASLIPFGINDDGSSYVIPDYLSAPGWVDGNYNATTHEYNLIVSRYIQQILDGTKKNNGMYITVPHIPAATSANRVIIGGGAKGSPYQMKLKISYTKLH